MCILLKLHYAKFDVSRLFRSKVIEEKLWRVGSPPPPPPPLGKGRVNQGGGGFMIKLRDKDHLLVTLSYVDNLIP